MSATILDFPAAVPPDAVLTRQQALAHLPKSYVRQLAAKVRAAIDRVDTVLALHEAGLSHQLGPKLSGVAVGDIREARVSTQDLLDDLMGVLKR
jgi:hypothetical protein